jgi:hypothetical protein
MAGGQVSIYGGEVTLNNIAGLNVPVVASSAPSPLPGLWWINTSAGNAVMRYNGTAWVAETGARYFALLSANPAGAASIAGMTEITTAGYSRQLVQWAAPTAAYPSVLLNTNTITFGPMTADMVLPATYLAMVTEATGTTGNIEYAWSIPAQQVDTSQNIQIAIGQFSLSQS